MLDSRVGLALSNLLLILVALAAPACGAGQKMATAEIAAGQAPQMPSAPPPLERSLFDRNPTGALTEDALQKILAAPIELDLPARVGIIPIKTATDWRGPGPDDRVPSGVEPLLSELRKSPQFTLLTQTMVIPSGALGMEYLREIAARYRLRYVMLYREVLASNTALNAIAWGYATVIGAFVLPGKDQEVWGYTEVSMFDVKTGTLMFTTRRAVSASQRTNQWHQKVKLEKLTSRAIAKFAPDLAKDVLEDLRDYANAAVAENARRGVVRQDLVTTGEDPAPTIAN